MSMSEGRGGRGSRLGDEFDRAEIDDHELDLADDHELRGRDWDDLHGNQRDHPTFAEAIFQNGCDRAQAARDVP